MLKLINPRLIGHDVVSIGFGCCVADAAEEFSRAPEVSFAERSSRATGCF